MRFIKAHCSGNDFIFIQGKSVKNTAEFVRKLSHRRFGVGADGVVFYEPNRAKVLARYFNCDGSEADFCGDALLTLGMLVQNGVNTVSTRKGEFKFEKTHNLVRLEMPEPASLKQMEVEGITGYFLECGVPHFVTFADDLEKLDVQNLGQKIRYNELFGETGTNVDFVKVIKKDTLKLRVYERGVEGETLGCGTGSVASAFVAHKLRLTSEKVKVLTPGGETTVELGSKIFLCGTPIIVFEGELKEPIESSTERR